MPFASSDGKLVSTRAEVRLTAALAKAILDGATCGRSRLRRVLSGRRASCALGAACEGIYHLPLDATGIRPGIDRAPVRLASVHTAQLSQGCKSAWHWAP